MRKNSLTKPIKNFCITKDEKKPTNSTNQMHATKVHVAATPLFERLFVAFRDLSQNEKTLLQKQWRRLREWASPIFS